MKNIKRIIASVLLFSILSTTGAFAVAVPPATQVLCENSELQRKVNEHIYGKLAEQFSSTRYDVCGAFVVLDVAWQDEEFAYEVFVFANVAYARHAGRQSTADERQRGEDDERERTRSGGVASAVSSEYDSLDRKIKTILPDTKITEKEDRPAYKIQKVEDASGSVEFEYGLLGEVVKERRTLHKHVNNSVSEEEVSVTEYRSDYLGRMQHIVYPDGEKVQYGYDAGGQVVSVTGRNFGRDFNYVTNILYDQYGQCTRIDYGNGTHTEYKYDAARRWLDSILTVNKHDEVYQNILYDFDKVGNVRSYTNDCLDKVRGNYKTRQEYEYDALYQLTKASGETTYNPYQSMTPEHVSSYEQKFAFDVAGLGNMVSKVSHEDVRPNGKSLGDGLNYSFEYVYDKNFAHRLVRAGNRWYKYDSNGNVIFEKDLPEGMTLEDDSNTVALSRVQTIRENVFAIDEGWGLFANDSPSARGRTNKRSGGRTYTWNERNQLVATVDDNRSTAYIYDYNGTRTNKYSRGTETLYFNQFYSMRFDGGVGYGSGQSVKHIYLGDTRIVTKLGSVKNSSYSEEYHKQYFYHSDHLGSASLISDFEGREYQRIEYTPYGETWVEKTSNTGMDYLPYKFTGKERDEETGLYYFGARYLDPQYSRWMSCDPALGDYIPVAPLDDEAKKHNSQLPGQGGIYNLVNLNLYHYGANNPITYKDPNGREVEATFEVTSYEKTNSGWMARGILTVTDKDTGKTITANAYSGGKGVDSSDGVSLPIPLGSYDILERSSKDGKTGYFRLEANDSQYGNDQVDGVDISQGTIRLHYRGGTYGCLSVEMKRNSSEYAELSGMISGTSSSRVFVDSKYTNPLARALFRYEGITKYGTLNVVQSKDMSSNQFSKDYTHQRMK